MLGGRISNELKSRDLQIDSAPQLHLNRYLLWRSLGAALGPAGQGLNFVA